MRKWILIAIASTLFTSNLKAEQATIAFVGDINFTGRIDTNIAEHGITWPFEKVKSLLATADYRVGNLEDPAGFGGEKYCEKSVYFKANPKWLDCLTDAKFDLVSLANNHSLDYGPCILAETMYELDKRHIKYMGIVQNSEQENAPVIVTINGIKFGFLAYCNVCPEEFSATTSTSGVVAGYQSRVIREIKKLRPKVDFLIVYPHWGDEYHAYNSNQSKLAAKAFAAGADVIIGSHPHVLQKSGFENNKNFIAYSMGNFVFPMRWKVSMSSGIVFVTFFKDDKSKMMGYKWVPVSLESNRPVPLNAYSPNYMRIEYIVNNGYTYPDNRSWPVGDEFLHKELHDKYITPLFRR